MLLVGKTGPKLEREENGLATTLASFFLQTLRSKNVTPSERQARGVTPYTEKKTAKVWKPGISPNSFLRT